MKKLRIKFLPGKQKVFIDAIYKKSGLSTKELAALAGIHPRSFNDWRHQKLTMSLVAAELFCDTFAIPLPEKRELLVKRWADDQKEANKKGGISRFKQHGSPGTPEGRKKGGIKAFAILRKKGLLPSIKLYKTPTFNESLAEYVGIMLGDGGITISQCTITLNRTADKEYVSFVSDLGRELFGEEPKRFLHKNDKAITLYYNGYLLVKYFTTIGLKIGNKVKQQVGVPDWIYNSQEYKIACLRGLMDTDGGVFLHRYKVSGKEYVYKKISFTNRSMPLLKFVAETLQDLGFTPKIVNKVENKRVWLYNAMEVERYLKIVKTHNVRLLKYNSPTK